MWNISIWNDFNDLRNSKTHLGTSPLGEGLRSTIVSLLPPKKKRGGGANQCVSLKKRNNWKALLFLYNNVSMAPSPTTPAFVWVQATYRQKAMPFIIEGNLKAVVWDPGSQQAGLDERGWGAKGEGVGKGHITFQMTEQRFIFQLAFLHEEEK